MFLSGDLANDVLEASGSSTSPDGVQSGSLPSVDLRVHIGHFLNLFPHQSSYICDDLSSPGSSLIHPLNAVTCLALGYIALFSGRRQFVVFSCFCDPSTSARYSPLF